MSVCRKAPRRRKRLNLEEGVRSGRFGVNLGGKMLRAGLLVFGGMMLAAAAFGALFGCRLAAMIPLALWGAILAGGVLVERWRYQLLADNRPGRDWVATPERFVDPETGRLVTVFFNPTTGERRYVADDNRETQEGSRGSPATPPCEG